MKAGTGGTAMLLALLFLALSLPADARDASARRAFVRDTPCPTTGKLRGACRGWEVDHIVPLCAGGADHPSNMQWIGKEPHKAKTRADVRGCKANPKPGK